MTPMECDLHVEVQDHTGLGPCMVVASDTGVVAISRIPATRASNPSTLGDLLPRSVKRRFNKGQGVIALRPNIKHPHIIAGHQFLTDYVNGKKPDPAKVAIDLTGGTEFETKVWKKLASLDRSATPTNYGSIASEIGHPGAHRAVGSAVGRNPLAFLIPCHCCIASDGALGGFSGGPLSLKTWAIQQETKPTKPDA